MPLPMAGLVINSPAGAYLLTEDTVLFTKKQFYEGLDSMYRYVDNNNYILNNYKTLYERVEKFTHIEKFSGKSLCSVLFPSDFVYNFNEDDKVISIREGILIKGRLTGAQVGSQSGSIIQSLWKRYGYSYACEFISNASFLFNWFAQFKGITISLRDITPLNSGEFDIFKKKEINKLNDFIEDFQQINGSNSDMDPDIKEMEIMQYISNTQSIIQKVFFEKYLDNSSSLQTMIKSKSKGSEIQVAYSSAFLMQQLVSNKRPAKLSTGGKRWLTTFDVKDDSIFSRGFCENSYLEGINPNEFFAQAQAARITITDTAVQTSNTGTMHRRMTKAQQDLVVQYDGSVRNNNNIIFQFNYGAGISAPSAVYSNDAVGYKIISFINMKELCTEINTSNGYYNSDSYSSILEEFNKINSKYGDDKISFETEENIINDMDNFSELSEVPDEDFEVNIDE
jgi:DNA-directed RNA polymerase beta' subunit